MDLKRTTLKVETAAKSLREFFLSGEMPESAEQVLNEDVLYMLLDQDGTLIEAIGTTEWFWRFPNWVDVLCRMKPEAVLIESPSGAVMVLAKLRMISALTSARR